MALFVGVVTLLTWIELKNPMKTLIVACDTLIFDKLVNDTISLYTQKNLDELEKFKIANVQHWNNCDEFMENNQFKSFWPSAVNEMEAYLHCRTACPNVKPRISLTIERID